ncbi:MAG: CLCA_X family protein [Kangiellaceae bacterium]|jgi:hypothetical protein|nr:CLCA_X family protein [Kangiellaceae bacterium]
MPSKLTKGIHREFYRNGPNHRAGADVTFGDIVKIFGFKSATVGAWVTAKEQQIAANLFFDALCDLMTILGVSEQVISLRGTLSIAFGHGGNKYASAHYSGATRTLALAKNAGAGALAHEYFHAFDHYIAERLFANAKSSHFASALWLEHDDLIEHPINHLLSECFERIFLSADGEQPSELFNNSLRADDATGTFYYARPEEVAARAFESFVQDHYLKNSFLVSGTKQTNEAKIGVYPSVTERKLISQSFAEYFGALGIAVARE